MATEAERRRSALRCPSCGSSDVACTETNNRHFHRCAACGLLSKFKGDALDALDRLADTTFLLVHLVEKGYRTDDQVAVVRLALQEAMWVLKARGVTPDGCEKCGSRHPDSSAWHKTHCGGRR
jgi:hypothetical protein